KRSREAGSDSDDLDQSHWPDIERRVILFRLVDDLPGDQRSVILKRFVEEKSIREIAEELRRSEGAVKQLQFRALENLRVRAGTTHDEKTFNRSTGAGAQQDAERSELCG